MNSSQEQLLSTSAADIASPTAVRRIIAQELHKHGRFSNLISAAKLLQIVLLCSCAFYLTTLSAWLALPLFCLIGIMQYHLSVGVHEACHLGLFKPKALNEAAGSVAAALLGFNLQQYRKFHLNHHKHYGLSIDPEYQEYNLDRRYRGPADVLWTIVKEKTLLGALRRFLLRVFKGAATAPDGSRQAPIEMHPVKAMLPVVTCQLLLLATFTLSGYWQGYFLFWVLPMTIFPGLLNGLRMFGEHAGLEAEADNTAGQVFSARTTVPTQTSSLGAKIQNWILGPFNFNYHHEHHLLPSISFQDLPRAHEKLLHIDYYTAHKPNLGTSYYGTIKQLFSDPVIR